MADQFEERPFFQRYLSLLFCDKHKPQKKHFYLLSYSVITLKVYFKSLKGFTLFENEERLETTREVRYFFLVKHMQIVM